MVVYYTGGTGWRASVDIQKLKRTHHTMIFIFINELCKHDMRKVKIGIKDACCIADIYIQSLLLRTLLGMLFMDLFLEHFRILFVTFDSGCHRLWILGVIDFGFWLIFGVVDIGFWVS